MFCTNCGKQIADTARFCNFCGKAVELDAIRQAAPNYAPQSPTSVSIPNAAEPDAPNSVPVASFDTEELPNIGTPAENTSETENGFSSPIGGVNTAPSYIPTPNVIPTSGSSVNSAYVGGGTLPLSDSPIPNAQPANTDEPAKQEKKIPERKYTFTHIMLCLIAVAVMAITAGVFAGLYFSVV